MKRNLLFSMILMLSGSFIYAQSFSDDFEAYSVGDYVGSESSEWTTWSGTTGGGEDARVTDAQASSGSNSIYFVGGPGPQDVVLPFGGRLTSGKLTYQMDMYIPAGKAGYFNFQGNVAPGTTWTMNTYLDPDGSLRIDDTAFLRIQSTYPQGEWFTLTYEANLTANIWKVSMDGVCLGSYAATDNAVASIDIFPATTDDEFYVDNVSYSYDPNATVPAVDGAVFNAVADLIGLAGSDIDVLGAVVNNGTAAITSFTIDYDVAGATGSQQFTGLNIATGQAYPFQLDVPINLTDGNNVVSMVLSEVNGNPSDEEECNNSVNVNFTGFTPADGRAVFIEEGTGTWCQWCPRGDVFMNRMEDKYHESFVGVAVHNGDPMVVDAWDGGIGPFPGFTGYPNVIVGRTKVVDPSQMEADIVSRIQVAPKVVFSHGASFDPATRELQISVTTRFNEDYSGNSWLIVGLTEDGVTGTGGGYNQSNAYAGGASGVMGGYELLPSSVPASQMVYNHVGRALLTPFNGVANPYGSEDISAGEERTHGYSMILPADWDIDNMNIITAMRNFFGQVDNAKKTTIIIAEEGGLVLSDYDVVLTNETSIYPNPFSDVANIRINLETPASVKMEVMDAMGKLIATRNYGTISGDQIFQFDGSNLNAGVYYMKLISGDKFTTKRVVIAR